MRADLSRRRGSTIARLALTALALVLFAQSFSGTLAAFTSSRSVPDNSFTTGTVTMSDNDSATTMLGLSGAKPGDSDTSCIRVTYTGSVPSTVRLYGTTTGTGLDAYVSLVVTRGTLSSGTFDNCSVFTPDATDYIGAGSGVVYSGTLRDYADDYAGGVVDPLTGTAETWTTSEFHDYRFVVTMMNNDSAQGKNVTQTFTWEARNI